MKYIETTQSDLPQCARWVELDPAHKGAIKGDFWLPPVDEKGDRIPGVKCVRVEDNTGAVFYLRLENVVRVYIQFPPVPEVSQSRVASALRRMFFSLSKGAKKSGYHEAIFDSKSKDLISFFKHFGFEDLKDTFQVKL